MLATRERPAARRPQTGVAPARRCAYAVVRRAFEQGAYADRALAAEAERLGLSRRDRALAMRLAYGVIQRRATLDHVLARLASRPVAQLDPAPAAALRLGLYQLTFMDGIAAHAAVDDAVELAKLDGPRGGHRLVNAVLRRAVRDARGIVADLNDGTPAGAAVRHSHPRWIVDLWWNMLGADATRALLAADNQPAESALRANTLLLTPAELSSALARDGIPARPAPEVADGLVVERAFDAQGSPLWRTGALQPQSRASMAVAHVLAPRPGDRVLDLCAAPGAKTTHLAALTGDQAAITAVERHAGRAAALERTCARLHVRGVSVVTADATRAVPGERFDRVLVDPPCTGLGTLRSRPDLRWRVSPGDMTRLARLQADVLDAAVAALAPGGTLVYSTCTISPTENEHQVAGLLARHPQLARERLPAAGHPRWPHPGGGGNGVSGFLQSLPHRDGTDGFFIARLRRRG